MDPYEIIEHFYKKGSMSYRILIGHGRQIARKALDIADHAPHIQIDRQFVETAALLHDIGMCRTRAEKLGCKGSLPYVCHGVQGREMLEGMGFSDYGLVCERHVGVGLTADDIMDLNLPLPTRDMMPLTDEEKLICYADKFYSKTGKKEKRLDEIYHGLEIFGKDKVERFLKLRDYFESDR